MVTRSLVGLLVGRLVVMRGLVSIVLVAGILARILLVLSWISEAMFVMCYSVLVLLLVIC